MTKTQFFYPNIKAEQSKRCLSNAETANAIGLSRVSYESKMKSGRFVVSEALKLCRLFDCDVHYLFATDEQQGTEQDSARQKLEKLLRQQNN